MNHCMIDIETMGTGDNAAVISIGLTRFNPVTGKVGEQLEVRNTFEAQRVLDRDFDPKTEAWWKRQSPEAQAQLVAEPRYQSAKEMMQAACDFIYATNKSYWDRGVWAKSPTFDLAILRHLANQVDVKWPCHFSREYCVRTLLLIAKHRGWHDILEWEPEIAHGALSDAAHQARQMMAVMKRLGR